MIQTNYRLVSEKVKFPLRLALVADLHGNSPDAVLELLRNDTPDMILAAGDIGEALDGKDKKATKHFFRFLEEGNRIAPLYYAFGNHELAADGSAVAGNVKIKGSGREIVLPEYMARIRQSVTGFLDDDCVAVGDLVLGGLTTGLINDGGVPNLAFIKSFSERDGFKVLLCHHPEYYPLYLKDTDVDLILSGHAHGGHWRVFGQGIFAPGQGLFPKYTKGFYDGKLIVTSGAGDKTKLPRICNPHEIVYIRIN